MIVKKLFSLLRRFFQNLKKLSFIETKYGANQSKQISAKQNFDFFANPTWMQLCDLRRLHPRIGAYKTESLLFVFETI